MAQGKKKVNIVVEAIDRVSAPIRAINQRIAKIAAPAREASRAMGKLTAESGLKRVAVAASGIGKAFGGLKQTLGGIVRAGGVAVGVLGGIFYALQRNANAGDEAVKAAQRYGVTITDWQRLVYAAESADITVQDLGGSLKDLSKRAVAAATGNQKMAVWFRRAGVSVTDMTGKMKPTRQLLEELADKFAAMPDGAKKTALAVALLGDNGAQMIPWLNGGAKAMRAAGKEAEALGLVNEKLARDQALFNDQIKNVGHATRGAFNAISSAVLPVLNELLPQLRDWIVANRELIASKAREFMADFRAALPGIVQGVRDVAGAIAMLARGINAVAQFFGGWKVVMVAVAAFMGAQLVLSIVAVSKAFYALGVAMMATPVGWILAGVAALAAGAYLIIKNWERVKKFFADLVQRHFGPLLWIVKQIVSLLPESVRKSSFGQSILSFGSAPAPSAIAPGGAAVNGQVTVKVETAPGVRARVTEQQSSGPVDLGVETGYAMAGAH